MALENIVSGEELVGEVLQRKGLMLIQRCHTLRFYTVLSGPVRGEEGAPRAECMLSKVRFFR
jgi:hypothetical protein